MSNAAATEPSSSIRGNRPASPGIARVVASVAAILIGAGMITWPLLSGGGSWKWSPISMDALTGAKINASLKGVSAEGVRLGRQGSRAVSLISVPLTLSGNMGFVVEVEAAVPVATADDSTDEIATPDQTNANPPDSTAPATVVLLWQTADVPEYKYETVEATLGPAPTVVRFSIPVAPSSLYRVGVQFPTVQGDVVIRRIAFPSLPLSERIAFAAAEFKERELFAAHSINMLRGPSILGTSLNSILFGLILLMAGCVSLVQSVRRHRISAPVVICIIVAVWMVEDARATINLARNARDETKHFKEITDPVNRIAAAHGGQETAWANELLSEHAERGERFCVISDDDFGPRHHLAYLLAPKLVYEDDVRKAKYIVVIGSSTVTFDADTSVLTFADESTMAAQAVAQLSTHVYILRRTGG